MKKFTVSAIAAIGAAGLLLTGCSGGSLSGEEGGGESGGGSEDLTPITVGLLQIAPASVVQLGIDEGVFEEHGLDVDVQLGQGGAALLPAVQSGDIQFAVGNPQSVLTAASQGLDMRIIANYSRNYENPEDTEENAPSGLVVQEDSGIESYSDLEGKTVAVNTLQTQGHLATMEMVEQDGGDPSKVEFTEIAFPDQQAQLEQGNIDAAWIPEPFISGAKATDGIVQLGDPLRVIDGLPTMVTFTSGDFAEADPETTAAFRDAITEAAEMAMADDELYRQAVVDFTGMDAAVVENVNLEYITGELDPQPIEELNDLAVKYGMLENPADLDTVIETE